MSIAVICPIGTLAENGYQHVAEPCIKSMAEFADAVYLVQSHNDVRNLEWRPQNARLISNPYTWFSNGYDGDQMNRNVDTGFRQAKDDGYHIGILMSSSSYIPKHHMAGLRKSLENIFAWEYCFRGNLIGGRLFKPSKSLPYIVRLRDYPSVRVNFDPDKLSYKDRFIAEPEYGDYSDFENISIIDVPLEMTLPEFAAKMNWVRCYSDQMPKRNPVMDWGYWREYHRAKVKRMILSDDDLDDYGRQIKGRIKPDFVSLEVLHD